MLSDLKIIGLSNWTQAGDSTYTASSNLTALVIVLIQLFPTWTACSSIHIPITNVLVAIFFIHFLIVMYNWARSHGFKSWNNIKAFSSLIWTSTSHCHFLSNLHCLKTFFNLHLKTWLCWLFHTHSPFQSSANFHVKSSVFSWNDSWKDASWQLTL